MICNFALYSARFNRRGWIVLSWICGFMFGIVLFLMISKGTDQSFQASGFAKPSIFGTLLSAVCPVILSSVFLLRRKYQLAGIIIFLKALSYGFSFFVVWQIFKGALSSDYFVFILLQSCSSMLMLFSCFSFNSIRQSFKIPLIISVVTAVILLSIIYQFLILN